MIRKKNLLGYIGEVKYVKIIRARANFKKKGNIKVWNNDW
jgi:hypothetical protein